MKSAKFRNVTAARNMTAGRFRNVIVCEDIRDEVGNKKSLMGVMAGDVIVADFPATIKIAFFMEYQPSPDDGGRAAAEVRLLQDDAEIAKVQFDAPVLPEQSATLILPTGLMIFEKEATLRILVAVNGRPEQEILSKKIGKAPATS